MDINFDKIALSDEQIRTAGIALGLYIDEVSEIVRKKDDSRGEHSLALVDDVQSLEQILDLASKKTSHSLRYVVVVGIGGSNLGAKAVYDSMRGHFDILRKNQYPKILFADTNDPEWLAELASFIESDIANPEEILITIITKSGKTTETLFNAEFLYSVLKKKFDEQIDDRLVVITNEGSGLWEFASKRSIAKLPIPLSVGGRYSVFTAAGLFPLAVAKFDIRGFLEGAHSILDHCLDSHILKNSAAKSAVVTYLHYQEGKKINDTFLFHPELESLGKWYRQLLAESVGKEKDLDKKVVNAGITPTVSIGSTDLHSMAQLYLGGPKDKMTTFVYSDKQRYYGRPLEVELFKEESGFLAGKRPVDVMRAILSGAKTAYGKKKLPFISVVLPGITEYTLGQFMQWKMAEVMFLAKLFNVDAFNQPNVGAYKKETKKILEK